MKKKTIIYKIILKIKFSFFNCLIFKIISFNLFLTKQLSLICYILHKPIFISISISSTKTNKVLSDHNFFTLILADVTLKYLIFNNY